MATGKLYKLDGRIRFIVRYAGQGEQRMKIQPRKSYHPLFDKYNLL